MAGSVKTPVDEQLKQLNNARKLVLGDTSYYPQIVQSVLPILQPGHPLPIRRWGADFLAEVFASPALKISQKETICLLVLETLKNLIQDPHEDPYVLRNAIQTCASIYPLAFNWVLTNSYDGPTWERVVAIKSRVLQIWDGAPPAIRICCIKFAQRVVLAQTVASSDRQRGDLNINLAMIPQNHPLLDPRHLEAEATGLLDRMLGILQENSSDAIVVDATLNSLSILVRTRPGTSNRIMTAVLSYNPLKLANSPITAKTTVLIRSLEKTTRMFLMHLVKRDPHNPNTPRLQQHAERLMRSRAEILDEGSRKRANVDANGHDAAKRQKLMPPSQISTPAAPSAPSAPSAPDIEIAPLEPGSHSLAELFTLAKDKSLASFDATHVPLPYVVKITITALGQAEPTLLGKALDGVRDRLEEMVKAEANINPETAPLGVDDDDDDYEPDFDTGEDSEQIMNKLDSAPPELVESKPPNTSLALGSVSLPAAPVLNPEMAAKVGQGTVGRLFNMMQTLDDSAIKRSKSGLSRLAASSPDREAWVTILARLATRSSAGLESISIKSEDGSRSPDLSIPDAIREHLYTYIMEDFRRRIEAAASWLCEEWYCDKVRARDAPQHYSKWVIKVMDGFISYLNPQDKVLTRFLSEMPELNMHILARVKRLCRDPAMVQLVTTSLYYLVMTRPPVRNMVLDTFQEIWVEFEDARPFAEKHLAKWRPDFVKAIKASQ